MSLDALTTFENFPAAQSVHAIDPVLVLYFPATHGVQLPYVPNHPTLQKQDVMLSPPATEYEYCGHKRHCDLSSAEYEPAAQLTQLSADGTEYLPAPQPVHSADPFMCLYFPATQAEQTPFVPVHPASHSQKVIVVLPAGEPEFEGQSEQFTDPKLALYWLIMHCEQ